MKITTLMTALATAALAALAPPAVAQPTYTLDGSTLTVEGAEVAVVRPADKDTPEPGLVLGVQLIDPGIAYGSSLAWELAPGVYAVTAFSPADPDGVRDEVTWDVAVDGPPPPQPLTRPEQIRLALFGLIDAVTRWRTLGPSDAELFAAVRAGPLAHPTQAGPAIR